MKKLFLMSAIVLLAAGCGSSSTNSSGSQATSATGNTEQTQQVQTTTTASTTSASGTSYTLAQVQAANSSSKCWAAVSGKVYDLTGFINKHPHGSKDILAICGTDATAAYTKQHGGQQKPEQILSEYYIGTLAQ